MLSVMSSDGVRLCNSKKVVTAGCRQLIQTHLDPMV